MDYEYGRSLSDDELAKQDIARLSLIFASGLPPTGILDIDSFLQRLHEWTQQVRSGIKKLLRQRLNLPQYQHYTDSQFRIACMITILQRDIGLRYNKAFAEGDYDGSDSRNLFVHGLLSGFGGACNTMPHVYAAIGRRLGYPIKLAHAKQHTFCRWESPAERFNIEATALGFVSRSDAEYLKWPGRITPAELQAGWYLRNLTPRQELASLIGLRANCLQDNFDIDGAVEANNYAKCIDPVHRCYDDMWKLTTALSRLWEGMGKQEKPVQTRFDVLLPVPKAVWEHMVYPEACKDMRRMLGIRRRQKLHQA